MKCKDCRKREVNLSRSKVCCDICLDKRNDQQKRYRIENKDKVVASQKRSMAKNPELYKKLKHLTYLRHKEDWYRQRRDRRARLANSEGSYTHDEWIGLLSSYGNKCLQCGSKDNIEADHVVPIAKGGKNSIDNIQPLCRNCNRKKWTKILDFRPFGRAILDWT